MNPVIIFNILGWGSSLVGLIGIFFILKAIGKMSGKLKTAMFFILISLISFIALGAGIGILTAKYDIPDTFGYIIVPLYTAGIVFMVWGGKTLLDVLKQVSGSERGKK